MTPPKKNALSIPLPPFTPDEALRLVHFLENAVAAIWKAHGPKMSELLLDRFCERQADNSDQEQAYER